jgi:hypothetical protein
MTSLRRKRTFEDVAVIYVWIATVIALLFTLMAAFAMDALPAMSLLILAILLTLLHTVRGVHKSIQMCLRGGILLAAGCFVWFVVDCFILFATVATQNPMSQ